MNHAFLYLLPGTLIPSQVNRKSSTVTNSNVTFAGVDDNMNNIYKDIQAMKNRGNGPAASKNLGSTSKTVHLFI